MTQQAAGLVFARKEVKYRVPKEVLPELLRRSTDLLAPDAYPHSNILSIYYDTPDNDLISRSLSGPVYKEKLRLRSYGVPSAGTIVFPELKKKYAGIVYKRRACLPCREAELFLNQGIRIGTETGTETDEQILREIAYFRDFYHPLPKLFIAYHRDSYVGIRQKDLRVTFDHNIRYREDRLRLSLGDDGTSLDMQGDYLMEVKAQAALPLDFVRILSDLELYPNSFSKYGTIYRQLHRQEPDGERSKTCLRVS